MNAKTLRTEPSPELTKRIEKALIDVRDNGAKRVIEICGATLTIMPAEHRPGTPGFHAEFHYSAADPLFGSFTSKSESGGRWIGNSIKTLAQGFAASFTEGASS